MTFARRKYSRLVLGLFVAITFGTLPSIAQTETNVPPSPTTPVIPSRNSSALDVPTLERVLAFAREQAPEVLIARAEVEASRSVGVGARVSPLLNPYLEVVAERGGRGVTRDLAFTAQLHTPIEIGGQRSRRISEADSFVEWRTASLEQLRAHISGATVRSYGECVAHTARIDTLSELLQSARAEASVLVTRRDAGDATERDTQLAEVERARAESQLKEVQASLNSALNELGRLTGQSYTVIGTEELFPKVVMTVPGNQQVPSAPAVLGAQAEARFYGRVDERLARERIPPLSVILQAGRGDLTETRLGAGLAWSLPAFRYNQGERAKAQAESVRARTTAAAYSRSIAQRLRTIAEEDRLLRAAVEELDRDAIPAATLATDSATRMQRAGKTDLLSVIVARRDLYLLKLRRLEIAQRSWQLLGDWVELTGKVPR
jgi:cobalt-zinc-cadmium efflux system outer membrane protein